MNEEKKKTSVEKLEKAIFKKKIKCEVLKVINIGGLRYERQITGGKNKKGKAIFKKNIIEIDEKDFSAFGDEYLKKV